MAGDADEALVPTVFSRDGVLALADRGADGLLMLQPPSGTGSQVKPPVTQRWHQPRASNCSSHFYSGEFGISGRC